MEIHPCTKCYAFFDVEFTTLGADDAVHQVGGVTCDISVSGDGFTVLERD